MMQIKNYRVTESRGKEKTSTLQSAKRSLIDGAAGPSPLIRSNTSSLDPESSSWKMANENSDESRRLGCSIVKKRFINLTSLEETLICAVDPEWRSKVFKHKTDLVRSLSEHLKISRATLYRGMSRRRPKGSNGPWHKLSDAEKEMAALIYLGSKDLSTFVRHCRKSSRLPKVSGHTWFRIFAYLSKKYPTKYQK